MVISSCHEARPSLWPCSLNLRHPGLLSDVATLPDDLESTHNFLLLATATGQREANCEPAEGAGHAIHGVPVTIAVQSSGIVYVYLTRQLRCPDLFWLARPMAVVLCEWCSTPRPRVESPCSLPS
jgi:hypothetical protein